MNRRSFVGGIAAFFASPLASIAASREPVRYKHIIDFGPSDAYDDSIARAIKAYRDEFKKVRTIYPDGSSTCQQID